MAGAVLQAPNTVSSSFRLPQLRPCRRSWRAALHASQSQKKKPVSISMTRSLIPLENALLNEPAVMENRIGHKDEDNSSLIAAKLLAVAEAAADRSEMHAIIGEQRNNWTHLLLHSINSIALTASLMAGLAAVPETASTLPLNVSSAVLFASAAGIMVLVNKVQPSQLAEEQRNAARLFKQLERSIQATLRLGVAAVDEADVEEAMEKVLALQKAYPLPLLPGMLEKFPKSVEPTRWWPEQRRRRRRRQESGLNRNGWRREMEEEMAGVVRILKTKDEEQYIKFGQLVLNINKTLAFAGPMLAGLAAAAAAASSLGFSHGSLPAAVGGALAAVVNTLEHGGQVGMVFELSRNCAGFYRRLADEIEFNLGEEEQMREQGEIFELKAALQLGRSLAELREFASTAAAAGSQDREEDFAGKLF